MSVCEYNGRQDDFKSLLKSPLYAPARYDIGHHCHSPIWATPIARLLAAGYSFLPNRYTEEGFLFRGMESGITKAIANGYFGHFNGSREECRVERVMDVCFLTHEIRDALTVADMGNDRDGGIVVIPATLFNRALADGNAAVMAIGDSGMVFRYPFLTGKILIDNIDALIVSENLAEKIRTLQPVLSQKLVIFNPLMKNNNEKALGQLLHERDINPAGVLPDTIMPRRCDLEAE